METRMKKSSTKMVFMWKVNKVRQIDLWYDGIAIRINQAYPLATMTVDQIRTDGLDVAGFLEEVSKKYPSDGSIVFLSRRPK